MKRFKFIISGNHAAPTGNPIPYERLLSHSWRASGRRYLLWREYVLDAFLKQTENQPRSGEMFRRHARGQKPIGEYEHATMSLKIYWKDCRHGDPDNIFKGIADTLFENDKHLDGSFKSIHAENKKGRLEIELTIN